MALVVLLIHLVVCVALIGLVLLQRSEGGALGIGGGGGGGSLMSGRGAADALARMTSVAGAIFLCTSLGLTFLSGASASNSGGSVFDALPQNSSPATPAPPPTATPPDTDRPDPTEGSAPQAAQSQLALIGPSNAAAATPTTAASAGDAAPRAAPLENRTPPAATPQRTTPPATTPASTPARQPAQGPADDGQQAAAATQPAPARPLILPNTSGGALTDAQDEPESVDVGNGLEAVRRDQRAGPDL